MRIVLERFDSSVVDRKDYIAHLRDLRIVRCDDDGRMIERIEFFDEDEDVLGTFVVECARRLVADEKLGPLDDGSADRRSLRLTAGDLIGKFVRVLGESQIDDEFLDLERILGEESADFDILAHIEVADQIVKLKDEAEMIASIRLEFFLLHCGKILAEHFDTPLVDRFDTAEDIEKR